MERVRLPRAKGARTLDAAQDVSASLAAAREAAQASPARVQAMLADARGLAARTPTKIVQDALAAETPPDAMPRHASLVSLMRQRWNADEVLAENAAEVSSAASSLSPAQISAAAAREHNAAEQGSQQSLPLTPPAADAAAGELAFRILVSGGSQEQEYDVLGSTTLTALREAIFCVRDHASCGPSLFGNYYFFAAPATFFVSARSTNLAAPLCAAIRRAGGTAAERQVEGVTLWDLHASGMLSLGPSLLLLHQGDCEHQIDILLVRRRPCAYPANAAAYPMLRFAAGVRRPMCVLCGKFWARYMCFADGVSGEDPSKFCSKCFKMVFYDQDGELQTRFAHMRVVPLRFAV